MLPPVPHIKPISYRVFLMMDSVQTNGARFIACGNTDVSGGKYLRHMGHHMAAHRVPATSTAKTMCVAVQPPARISSIYIRP